MFFIITPLAAYITSSERLHYFSRTSLISFVGALVFWSVAGWYFKSLPLPEAHAHDGRITLAGVIHLGFAVAATWLLAMFYFSQPPVRDLIVASVLLTPFFFLGVYKFDREWKWNPVAVGMTFGGPIAVWSVVLWRLLR